MRASLFLVALLVSAPALSWDGYDYDTGSSVEIEKGNLVRRGKEIEYYDYGTGQYRTGEVQSVRSRGRGAEVEVYDYGTGETRTFDMDRPHK